MRQRLLVSAVALVLSALLAFALPLAWSVRGLLEARALDALQGTVEPFGLFLDASRNCAELQLLVARAGGLPLAVAVIGADGRLVATTGPAGRPRLGPEVADAGAGRPGRHIDEERIAVALRLSTLVCGQPLVLHATTDPGPVHTQVRRAWLLIAVVAAVVAGSAAVAAWALGRRLARPFEQLATSAGRLGEGDFSARAPRSGLPEADRIADALDDTAERLGRSVERAGAFAADASHQLRTPLTALRLHLETSAAAGADPSVQAALDEADRLASTIDELVALTRPDATAHHLDLGGLVRERLPVWEELAAQQDRRVVLEALPVPAVRARAGAVGQALQVLLDNALRHGTGTITVRVAPALPDEPDGAVRVCVLDEGPARSRAPAATGEHHAPAATGGRGLPLARALIGAEGGELTVTIDPTGTAACLLLPGGSTDP
ncbi:sensor histidine kinase [Egicoccus sp. AB-alg6-2]|uniref:sensor histidine kinase n=1 Tax=Egicoccus sp. AB-alg6-2 TaxID=3242692 RepID=UPI00359DD4A3